MDWDFYMGHHAGQILHKYYFESTDKLLGFSPTGNKFESHPSSPAASKKLNEAKIQEFFLDP